MKPDILTYLIIGLVKYYEQPESSTTMCPKELQYALNHLSLSEKSTFPKTFHGFLQQCQRPLNTWWPTSQAGIDMNMPLVEDDGLSFTAENYLQDNIQNIHLSHPISTISSLLENNHFRMLRQQLKTAYLENPDQAQTEYILLRRFLIENPFTSLVSLMQTFRETQFIQKEQVRELYLPATEQSDLTLNQHKDYYHTCPRCGPLYAKHGTLQSIKPSVCTSTCPQIRGEWQQIKPENQLVLRRTHQKRILIPGIPELDLFADLKGLHETYPEFMEEPQLWPYLDTYDMELRFNDAIWIVDVKDHYDPYRLGKQIQEMSRTAVVWDRAFYVYPDDREEQTDYCEALVHSSRKLNDTEVTSNGRFLNKVQQHLKILAGSNK